MQDIENLEKCGKVEVLNLSHNTIEKVEKLDKPLKLLDLNLSFNKISLQKLQTGIQVAEGNEDHHLQILKEAEKILLSKKHDLERLKGQLGGILPGPHFPERGTF
ncbi:centriolin-like [Erythrolamprus reginae]|uniref:centriolin-like n=1 Tax=Erythrolamprus reginae TaxID=121349 RepID=UPI00396CA2D3